MLGSVVVRSHIAPSCGRTTRTVATLPDRLSWFARIRHRQGASAPPWRLSREPPDPWSPVHRALRGRRTVLVPLPVALLFDLRQPVLDHPFHGARQGIHGRLQGNHAVLDTLGRPGVLERALSLCE